MVSEKCKFHSGGYILKTWGWGLIIAGGLLQAVETMQKADAAVNNVPFNTTGYGKIIGSVENYLPASLGWSMVGVGAVIVYFC